MVLPMVNEAARCLREAVVQSPAHLDLAMILGTGFPPFRGGLCRWADSEGVYGVVNRLKQLEMALGPRFAPAPELLAIAAADGFYASARPAKAPISHSP
jgi:3-hydroxyacyl-CoA dehydrogenase/enoyl-CoA hydratase/3-hydroxybutyryl-CoA epimerase